ncbi:MAG: PadR family transcriptional regulator [Candidatus Geothermarchaeales archaeon]
MKRGILQRGITSFLDLIALSLLRHGPMHGYGLIAEIHDRFRVLISPGTPDPLLSQLEEAGLVNSSVDKRRRRTYHLVDKGEKRLEEMLQRLSEFEETLSQLEEEQS